MEKYTVECLVPGCVYEVKSTSKKTTYFLPNGNKIEICGLSEWNLITHETVTIEDNALLRRVSRKAIMPGMVCIPPTGVLVENGLLKTAVEPR